MKRILIIGGTGMLKDASSHFIVNGFDATILGHNTKNLSYFTDQFPNNKHLHLISQDYYVTDNFISIVEENIKAYGAFDLVITWMHSGATDSLLKLIALTNNAIHYHIKSSSYYNPTKNSNFYFNDLDYREVFLGFMVENNKSRWLSNNEISNGVIEAVKANRIKSIIGQIEPWESRP